MENIKIIATGKYLPSNKVSSEALEKELNLQNNFIYSRTGIKKRYYCSKEDIADLAINSVYNLLQTNSKVDIKNIDLIIVATTSTDQLMPGITYQIQKEFNIEKCMCLDILAGCAGFINAFDIARNYIAIEKVKNALVIGVDILSKYTNKEDISTSIILSDGAGATIISKTDESKMYSSEIISNGQNGNILTNSSNRKIVMDGKEIYKYAVTETVKNVKNILEKNKIDINEIKYIVPHQANMKIINSISNRLKIEKNKMYTNIENVGNTFCASIPIALDDMMKKNLLKSGDKVIFLGFGGGLNTGSILLEV